MRRDESPRTVGAPGAMRRALPDALVMACLLALVLLFFWRFLTPKMEDRVALPSGDFTDQFYAWRLYEGRELSAGRIPLWNPYYNSGHPFLADSQSAVFYPIGLAVTLLASRGGDLPIEALQWEAFLHVFLAGVFTYFLARRLLLREAAHGPSRPEPAASPARFGALVAALTFAFGGYLTSYPLQQLAVLETITWLPLALLCLDILAERGGLAPSLLAGGALAMAALAGHAQTFLFVLYACLLYSLFRVWVAGRASTPAPRFAFYLSRLGLLLTSLAVALGLSAVQIIPALEYTALSTRSGISYLESAKGMPPLDQLQIIFPGSVSAFASPLYVGILPLWLAAVAVVVRRDRRVLFWAALALVALLVAFGGYSFLYGTFYLLAPGFSLFRGQERAAGIFSLALAVLAGYGAFQLARPLSRSAKSVVVATHRLLNWAPLGGLIATLAFFYATRSLAKPGAFVFLVDRAALMTLLFILSAVVVALRLWGLARPPWIRLLAVLLILFDLFTINWYNNQAPVAGRFPSTPLVRTMQADSQRFRIAANALPGHAGVVYGLADLGGISPLRLRTYDDLLRALPESRLWSLLNVRYVVEKGRDAPAGSQVLHRDGDATLYRLAEPLPPAWVVGRYLVEPDGAKALALLASPDLDPLQTVVLTGQPAALSAAGGPGTATITEYLPERMVIEVSAPAGGLLVMSENYFPGWRALVDGQESPIYRADHTLRTVLLPAGARRVEMIYDPLSFRLGLALSGLTLCAVAVALVLCRRRRGAP